MSAPYLTGDHEDLRQHVRDFAETEITAHVARMESSRSVEEDLATRIAQQGWLGATIHPAFGGMGAGHMAKTIIIEEISRVSGAMGAMVQASQLGTAKIIHFGSEEQRKTWLPQIAAGTCLPTIAVTEEGCGGHVLAMRATARRDGDNYILNGRKTYVGNSHIGHLHGVVARTGHGTKGLSAFLVEADRSGVILPDHPQSMGLHGFSFGEIVFDNCRIPAANRLGQEGQGLDVAYSSSILYGRPNLGAVALGIHQAIMEQTRKFVTERQRYGGPLAKLPAIQQKLGEMQSHLMTARLTAYHAAHLLDHGQPCDAELINAKHVNVRAARDSARLAMDIHAAAGLFTTHPLERFFRDVEHLYAPAGTGEIQQHRLSEISLGTYRSQWSVRLAAVTSLRGTTGRELHHHRISA
ncbi:acyl-CoA dehydrogenase [Streptomyces sp. Ru73]|uniref:acyl-CoA dehydrogenase family protein n=1 Tax=Streptomyces sp. Ru73 TaxID=2080748 RepID=UPI000CDCFE33|nr:acyl-CoA dehydrogenase family protein [Streptomyces sp. Ru73]POX43028.1 acyl-CoA dehydrogenase [Streptomyces sp. Ru73]